MPKVWIRPLCRRLLPAPSVVSTVVCACAARVCVCVWGGGWCYGDASFGSPLRGNVISEKITVISSSVTRPGKAPRNGGKRVNACGAVPQQRMASIAGILLCKIFQKTMTPSCSFTASKARAGRKEREGTHLSPGHGPVQGFPWQCRQGWV